MTRLHLRPTAAWWPWLVVIAASIIPLFAELGTQPIHLWDESRLAMSSLEMAYGEKRHLLVTTYRGFPDFWNTKPPLLIWLQALSLRTLGISEWALRLPSALAAVGTGLLLVGFAQRHLRRPWLGAAAACVLFCTPGYVAIHGVRTGDYDALLTFFTTAYALAWAGYIETGRRHLLYASVTAIAAAVLTKGVAGLLPLPALLLYALLRGKSVLLFRTPHPYIAAACLLLVVGSYYGAREVITPGYLAAVQANELGGRFTQTLEGHSNPKSFYFQSLFTTRFIHWMAWWLIGGILGLASREDARLRHTTIFALLFAGVHLIIISSAGTRIEWYDLPSLPFMALVAGIGIHTVVILVREAAAQRGIALNRMLLAGIAGAAFIIPYTATKEYVTGLQQHPWDGWHNTNLAWYMQSCLRKGKSPAAEVMVWDDYEANVEWYLAAMRIRGIPTPDVRPYVAGLPPGTRVLTHIDPFRNALERNYYFDTLRTYENLRFYQLRQVRPPDTARSYRP